MFTELIYSYSKNDCVFVGLLVEHYNILVLLKNSTTKINRLNVTKIDNLHEREIQINLYSGIIWAGI